MSAKNNRRGFVSQAEATAWQIRVNHEEHSYMEALSPRRHWPDVRRNLNATLEFAEAVVD